MDNAKTGKGLLFILVGPGGVGKNTLMQAVLPRFDHLSQLATATTRMMRPNEISDVHHIFVSQAEFERMIADNELVEYEQVHPGKYYGVPRKPLETAITNGTDLIADIEISGAAHVRRAYPENTVLIFIKPPSLEILAERMQARGENPTGIAERMERAAREMPFAEQCDYVIENDEGKFEAAAEELYQVILKERSKRDQLAEQSAVMEISGQ